MPGELEIIEPKLPAPVMELSADDIIARLRKIGEVQSRAMVKGVDYGEIPGTGGKPTLFKAGAEKLGVLFRLDPQFTGEIDRSDTSDHITVYRTCTLYHQVTGQRLGSASAICTTRESKYAWRKAERVCPACGNEAIILGKKEFGGGWLCWKKRGGCGAKFQEGDQAIEGQQVGRIPNPDIADQYNTVVRMCEKRALVAATRLVTGASAIFDEESPEVETPLKEHVEPADEAPDDPADSFKDVPVFEDEAFDAPPIVLLNENQVKELDDLFAHICSFPADGAKEFRDKAMKRWSLKSLHDMAQSDFQRRKEILEAQVKIYEGFSRVRGKK